MAPATGGHVRTSRGARRSQRQKGNNHDDAQYRAGRPVRLHSGPDRVDAATAPATARAGCLGTRGHGGNPAEEAIAALFKAPKAAAGLGARMSGENTDLEVPQGDAPSKGPSMADRMRQKFAK